MALWNAYGRFLAPHASPRKGAHERYIVNRCNQHHDQPVWWDNLKRRNLRGLPARNPAFHTCSKAVPNTAVAV